MFLYFQWSFRQAASERGILPSNFSTREWLEDVSLFDEAWSYVCATASRFWWSEQLMYWTTGPLAMLMAVEGIFTLYALRSFLLLFELIQTRASL